MGLLNNQQFDLGEVVKVHLKIRLTQGTPHSLRTNCTSLSMMKKRHGDTLQVEVYPRRYRNAVPAIRVVVTVHLEIGQTLLRRLALLELVT